MKFYKIKPFIILDNFEKRIACKHAGLPCL